MTRRAATLLSLLSAIALVGTYDAGAQDGPKQDPEKLFKHADKDRDGKLSREEFRELIKNRPRFKENPDLADRAFDRLDADGDGSLTLGEFRKIAELGQKAGKKEEKKEKPPAREEVKEVPATAEGLAFFEKKIRPALVKNCVNCHSAAKGKTKGNLDLDSRAGLRAGGEGGLVIVPGHPEKSRLLVALSHKDEDLKMPPSDPLPAETVADFEKWVKMGAPDPREEKVVRRKNIDVEKGREFWSFQRPKAVAPGPVKDRAWARDDIDRYLLAAMEAKGLKPVADTDRRTLVRRAYLDLIGLPPALEEVEAFVKDDSPKAFEKVVDKLLQSPRYGERWGRHWLDVARFAETSGRQVNINYPQAWRYRDWVIAAFNSDKPYDRFVTEQLAGDLLDYKDNKQKADQIIATGFLAVGSKPHNERGRTQFQYEVIDEQIDTVGQAFLGLTIACARCHDHKFDPIPMRDYYAMAGIFRSTETRYGTPRVLQNNHPSDLYRLPEDSGHVSALEKASAGKMEGYAKQLKDIEEQREKLRKEGKLRNNNQGLFLFIRESLVRAQRDQYEKDGTPKVLAMGVRDRSSPSDSPLFERGEIPRAGRGGGRTVPRGFVQVVSKNPPKIKRGSGRMELTEWLTKDNPLTARVMVNRVWLHLFGRGIVTSPDNFGTTGSLPSHPELLDHLALSFEKDWSVKKLIRRIVLTRAYQLASAHDEKNYEADPDNVLVWRMSKRRLEAEPLRDSMLAVAGTLDLTPPRGSAVALAGEGPAFGGGRRFGAGPPDARATYRSVYLPVIRDQQIESMSLFDFGDAMVTTGERPSTTVPSQSLYLMNNPFVIRLAEAAAAKIEKVEGKDADRIRAAYLRFLSRPPSAKELKTAETFLAEYPMILEKDGVAAGRRKSATWSAFCQALFGSAEFQYRN